MRSDYSQHVDVQCECGSVDSIQIYRLKQRKGEGCAKCQIRAFQKVGCDKKNARREARLAIGKKRCSHCKADKELCEFTKNDRTLDGLQVWCKQCQREAKLKKKYGLSPNDYARMVREQNDSCAICGVASVNAKMNKGVWYIDHDHKTGAVRSLLCGPCNVTLGVFEDDPNRLEQAAAYLKRHRGAACN